MARRTKPGGKIRLNLAISPEVRRRLESLQESTDADSFTEVIRRALAVYEALVQSHDEGGRVLIEDEDGEVVELRIVPH